jgi:hypothetical protein
MSKAKTPAKVPATNIKTLQRSRAPDQTDAQAEAAAAVMPSLNAAIVVDAFQRNIMGEDLNFTALIDSLRTSSDKVKAGDLSTLEAMLIGQATALQTIFTSLAKRAVHQEQMAHYQTFLGLALKAQAQSRVTISALVDLKYPRQATFVKQANIAHGPQQVNNGGADLAHFAPAPTHGKETEPEQNKLLEADHGQPRQRMDTRAAQKAERSYQAVETVEPVHRAKKPGG